MVTMVGAHGTVGAHGSAPNVGTHGTVGAHGSAPNVGTHGMVGAHGSAPNVGTHGMVGAHGNAPARTPIMVGAYGCTPCTPHGNAPTHPVQTEVAHARPV